MKKFLTVLLVIAVMFTFSFSSAFAAVDWTGETASKYLTEAGDYDLKTALIDKDAARGTEGITEAYRAKLLADADDVEDAINAGDAPYAFYAPEEAKALKLVADYKDAIKTVKTAKDAAKLTVKLLDDGADVKGELKDLQKDYEPALKKIAASTATLNLSRLMDRYEDVDFYLPGYGTVDASKDKTYVKTLVADKETKFVETWLMDNDYRTDAEITDGIVALVAALVPMTDTYMDNVKAEQYAIQTEIYKYADKLVFKEDGTVDHVKTKLTVADLEAIDALIVKMGDFADKYDGLVGIEEDGKFFETDDFDDADFDDAVVYLAEKYFDQYCAEVSAVPATSKLVADDKAKVLALKAKVDALGDTYENVWDYVEDEDGTIRATCPDDYACNYDILVDAYEYFLKKDVDAFEKLDAFDEITKGAGGKYYFDASEKNVNALKAQRAAYNALVADYGYYDLNDVNGMTYAEAAAAEALILAAENNMGADADYDVKDVTKLQNYLNNATLKVTTTALGNTKIRVQARFDAETYKDIVAECGNDYTISYKFYHKTAKATAFKGPKEKDRNYITYTKLSLKKGVKYKFQCGVVIKDAQGNVVAEKSYKASTTGSRVCR